MPFFFFFSFCFLIFNFLSFFVVVIILLFDRCLNLQVILFQALVSVPRQIFWWPLHGIIRFALVNLFLLLFIYFHYLLMFGF